ncbi:peptide ABC transporter ATPase [Nocardioides sp. ChNu-153]|uniref:WcbI family polysaccharide biosynthesis putative acetyltransferase n=1 Tax=Nocardioides sp. ChNu-153 TaxID=2779364 RepID=UPI0026507CF3|nr:WcbI family polysaccharide biosynthesis putative acetyltransferase [Nocardioides sp. ChNu-153]MDN7119819.1 peptide ABC transporter ATPase [Nocardioides sp. ChNu-153]
MTRSEAERQHFGAFHGLRDADPADASSGAAPPAADAPLVVVVGNCQAESLRLLLASDDVRTVRLPAIHELGADDVPLLRTLLARTDLFVSQPVGAGYRGLPLGTEELAAHLPPSARTVLVPPIRYHGLHPWHVVAHPPGLAEPDPPRAAYHDLRTLAAALGAGSGAGSGAGASAGPASYDVVPDPAALRELAAASVTELERRQRLHGTVAVADLFARPSRDAMRTVNHPGNVVLAPVAARVREAAGLASRPPGVTRPLLAGVHAPLEAPVLAALDLPGEPEPDWRIAGQAVPAAEVAAAHRAFYAARPDVVEVLVRRYAPTMRLLGLPGV